MRFGLCGNLECWIRLFGSTGLFPFRVSELLKLIFLIFECVEFGMQTDLVRVHLAPLTSEKRRCLCSHHFAQREMKLLIQVNLISANAGMRVGIVRHIISLYNPCSYTTRMTLPWSPWIYRDQSYEQRNLSSSSKLSPGMISKIPSA